MKPAHEEVPSGDIGGNLGGEEKTCVLVLFIDFFAREDEAIRLPLAFLVEFEDDNDDDNDDDDDDNDDDIDDDIDDDVER